MKWNIKVFFWILVSILDFTDARQSCRGDRVLGGIYQSVGSTEPSLLSVDPFLIYHCKGLGSESLGFG